jgi:hypothetical protein
MCQEVGGNLQQTRLGCVYAFMKKFTKLEKEGEGYGKN